MTNVEGTQPQAITWIQAFPWIQRLQASDVAPWWDVPVGHALSPDAHDPHTALIEMVTTHRSRTPLGQIFPMIPGDLVLERLDLNVRASNALGRQGAFRMRDLSELTVNDLLGWPNVGAGTVDEILRGLTGAATVAVSNDAVTLRELTSLNAESSEKALPSDSPLTLTSGQSTLLNPTGSANDEMPQVLRNLIDDLQAAARWQVAVGRLDHPIVAVKAAAVAPEKVSDAWRRIGALSARDVLSADELTNTVAPQLELALSRLTDRAVDVLTRRFFADRPETLEEIGSSWSVTRERVRQVESAAVNALREAVTESETLNAVYHATRGAIGELRALQDLLAEFPALAEEVSPVRQPVWRVLDRLDDDYEIKGGWCAEPTIAGAIEVTMSQLNDRCDRFGVVRLDELRLVTTGSCDDQETWTRKWLEFCQVPVAGDLVFTRTQSAQDEAAAVLSIAGRSMTVEEIVSRLSRPRAEGSVRNALFADDRFVRSDKDLWALREWGGPTYTNIRTLIGEVIDAAGGQARVDEVIETITSQFSVAPSSVMLYASVAPYVSEGGLVRRGEASSPSHKLPEQTKHMYRRSNGWVYRITVNGEHARGSGSPAPVAAARLVGLQPGSSVELPSRLEPQRMTWVGGQPLFGSIRRFLITEDVSVGSQALLVLDDDGTFDFELLDHDPDDVRDLLLKVGASSAADFDSPLRTLAKAIRLDPDTPVNELVAAYRERGDVEIADIMARTWLESDTNAPPESGQQPPS